MTTHSFKHFVEQNVGRHGIVLIYAILEFVMILFLLLDGLLALFSSEFAKFFELEIPCFLCTRIDLVLLHTNFTSYSNASFCKPHKKEISSLAYCHAHKLLSDIRTKCEGCLLSFAAQKDSADCDRYKSLVGILHKDINCFLDNNDPAKTSARFSNRDFEDGGGSVIQRCSCCGEFLKSEKFMRSASVKAAIAPPPSPLHTPRAWTTTEEVSNLELPHIHYTELKLVSNNDSELSNNDSELPDDDVSNAGGESCKSITMPLLPDSGDLPEDACKTLSFSRGNKFSGIPLSDSTQASPRLFSSKSRKMSIDFLSDLPDMNYMNEGDDEILCRLKRQVRLDRRSLMALYMELDEERSASAVAANNAMAMITRLQAEKAAVQMEALQYQRMMDEHAEYYREELQVMKDLLLKKEEEVKALESEHEMYREKYGPISKPGSEICEVDTEEDYQGMRSQCISPFSEQSDSGNPDKTDHEHVVQPECSGENVNENIEDSSLENERSRLLCLLSNFEKRFNVSSDEESLPAKSDKVVEEDHQECRNEKKGTLTREMSVIRERLRAIEAESGFIKHAAMTLQREDEGIKLLTEISDNLRKLRAL